MELGVLSRTLIVSLENEDDVPSSHINFVPTPSITLDSESFYFVHNERPFFKDLTEYMSRSSIVAAVLKKDNAVSEFRKLIGNTDPSEADKGTLRAKYAISKGENSIHGSDSDENAMKNYYFDS